MHVFTCLVKIMLSELEVSTVPFPEKHYKTPFLQHDMQPDPIAHIVQITLYNPQFIINNYVASSVLPGDQASSFVAVPQR